MATDSAGDTGYRLHTPVTQCLVAKVSYTDDDNRHPFGVLPPKSYVVRGRVLVVTGFDDTTADDIDIGVTGGDDDLFGSAIDINTGSNATTDFDDLAAANWYSASAREVTWNFSTAATGDGAAGEAYIYIEFIRAPDGS